MRTATDPLADPRVRAAIAEVQDLILVRYPNATFSVWVGLGDDKDGIYIEAAVDSVDLSEVVDAYSNRLVDLHVDEGLPVHVIAVDHHSELFARRGGQSGTNANGPTA